MLAATSCGGDDDDDAGTRDRAAATAAGDLALGARVYAENCARCHGANGQGGTGPKLADGRVVDRYPDARDHREVVVGGRGAMPAWGRTLSDEQIDAVVRYEREGL